jgi:ParB family chromosome partitioning protein
MRKRVINDDSPLRRALATTEPGQVRAYADAVLVPLARLHPDPDQPRRNMDEAKLQELAESIKKRGVLQPILVRQTGDDFAIIAGHRRYQAACLADLEMMPCVVRDSEHAQAREESLIENLQREDLDPLEEAIAYKALVDTYGYSIRAVAGQIHKSVGYVHSRLELGQHSDVAKAVQTLNVGVYAARELAKIDEQLRRALLKRRAAGDLDDQGLVEAVRAARAGRHESVTPRLPWTFLHRALVHMDPASFTPSQRTRARRELSDLRGQIDRLLEELG